MPVDKLTVKNKENIICEIGDCMEHVDILLESDFIVIDVDPHDGIQETYMIETLRNEGYKGLLLLLLDDINLNPDMRYMFDSIPEKKYDITKYGHFSGTGIVIFDPSRFDFILS